MKRLTAPNVSVLASALASAVLVVACGGSDNGPDIGPNNTVSGNGNPGGAAPVAPLGPTEALYQVAQGILPYPIDLFFLGSTDSTLNLPANALVPNQAALNALDGYSTTAPIRVRFGSPIDPTTLTAASVVMIRLTLDNATKAPIPPSQGGVVQPLVFDTDFTAGVASDAGVGNTILEIRPTRPLVASTGTTNSGYLVVLTNGIRTATGAATTPDTDYAAFKAALPSCAAVPATVTNLCLLTGAQLSLAQAVGVTPANVTMTFSFTTQSTRDTMAVLANPAVTTAQAISVAPTGGTTATLQPGTAGTADVYTGTFTIPYYLSRPSQANPTAPLTAFWLGGPSPLDANSRFLTRFNPRPVATETIQIPILVTVPNAGSAGGGVKPAAGWPVLIFQHGLTRSRRDGLLVADAFANAIALGGTSGYVVVSIDLPLHGITDTTDPLYDAARERTFNLNVVTNTTLNPPADTAIDPSGASFINLSSPLTSRDNLRQGAVDLLALARSVGNMDLNGDGTSDIDPTRVHFVGHSLGSIVGGVFLGVAGGTEVRTGVLAMSGGGLAQALADSPTYSPRIVQGLAANGIAPGTTLFNQFLRDIQTVVDSGDPLNYIQSADAAHPLLLFQVIGGGTLPAPPGGMSLPDQAVVNSATQRLLAAMNLPRISTAGANATTRGYVNFVFGEHGSLIDPRNNADVTAEMQRESVVFSNSLGTIIQVFNPAVIQP